MRGKKCVDEVLEILEDFREVPNKIQELVDQFDSISQLAHNLRAVKSVLFLGRNVGYPVALEGALKLKELAYIHAEGVLLRVNLNMSQLRWLIRTCLFLSFCRHFLDLSCTRRSLTIFRRLRHEGAQVFTIADAHDAQAHAHATFIVDRPVVSSLLTPLLDVIPLQIFAYALATSKGLDVGQAS